jgi:hypothetical protein
VAGFEDEDDDEDEYEATHNRRLLFPGLKLLPGSEKMTESMEMLESGLLHVKRDLFQIPKTAEVGRDARRRGS